MKNPLRSIGILVGVVSTVIGGAVAAQSPEAPDASSRSSIPEVACASNGMAMVGASRSCNNPATAVPPSAG